MILIRNVSIYTPAYIGIKDVLIAGGKIVAIEKDIHLSGAKVEHIDGSGKYMVPGFIDHHVHITGGGGENGFRTRVPEVQLSELIDGGITTVLGLLGTDGVTRDIENLVAKAKGLKEEGISVYVTTGSYAYPSITLTQSVRKDITFIDEVIGVKIALSDHRSSYMTDIELLQLASDVRVAGMISGKSGIVVAHMGDGKQRLNQVKRVLELSELPITVFRPTHVNRKADLLYEAIEFANMGGTIDLTAGLGNEVRAGDAISDLVHSDFDTSRITVSSDGNGSFKSIDEDGNVLYGVASVNNLYQEFLYLVQSKRMTIENSLPFFTSNVAQSLGVAHKKGRVQVTYDADLLILDENLKINTVIANGLVIKREGSLLRKGTFER